MKPVTKCRLMLPLLVSISLWARGGPAGAQIPPQVDLDKIVNDYMTVQNLYAAKKPKAIATYLAHESMIIRGVAVSCLGGLGLPKKFGKPYQQAEELGDAQKVVAAVEPIREWALTAPSLPDPVIDTYSHERAVDSVIMSWVNCIRDWNMPDEWAYSLLRSFPAFVPKLRNDSERLTAITFICEVLDAQELNAETGQPIAITKKEDVAYWLPVLQQWVSTNLPYLYFHRNERRLKLDLAARTAGIPSKDYRTAHPWGSDEGPNHTDPRYKASPDDEE